MIELNTLEIGKIKVNATSWSDREYKNEVSLDWVEHSSYMKSYDQECSVDIEKDDAIALIDLLSKSFGIDDASKLTKALEFKVNRLEQFIMHAGYGLPSMGESDDVKWVNPVADIKLLREALIKIARPLDCGCSPCTGSCQSEEALSIEVEELKSLAFEALELTKSEE